MTLEEAYRKLKKEFKSLEIENTHLKNGKFIDDIHNKYKSELHSLRLEIASLKRRCTFLENDNKQKEMYIKMIQDQLRKANEALQLKDDELSAIKNQLDSLAQEKEQITSLNAKLKAQVTKNYENSSIPSSMVIAHKKITNNREKSGKHVGAQEHHEHHARRVQIPTSTVINEEHVPDGFIFTGEEKHRQLVDIEMHLIATDFVSRIYRNPLTGEEYYADFPKGIDYDVNYGSTIKSLAFYLNNTCNVSIRKTCQFINDLTHGAIQVSTGMVSDLKKKFASKLTEEHMAAFLKLQTSPVMYSDATTARVNGDNCFIHIFTDKENVLYLFNHHKGKVALDGSPVDGYQGIIVHDHDKTYYQYGSHHQECLAHLLRYLKGSIENEPHLNWNKCMHTLLQLIIHETKTMDEVDEDQITRYEIIYDEIVSLAEEEYKEHPASMYYRDGYNLYKRFKEYKDNTLLFLSKRNVDYTNNLSERLGRTFKSKMKQVGTFRSEEGIKAFVSSLSALESKRMQGEDIYSYIADKFAI